MVNGPASGRSHRSINGVLYYVHTNRFCVVQENIKPEVLKVQTKLARALYFPVQRPNRLVWYEFYYSLLIYRTNLGSHHLIKRILLQSRLLSLL